MSKPTVCILKTDGINCDEEMAFAFDQAGARSEIVHVNQLRNKERVLKNYSILAIPGGFSYGDDIISGKVLATELSSYLTQHIKTFVQSKKPILGVCNGFQILVRMGLLPDSTKLKQTVTLAENDLGRFECRWVELDPESSLCQFVQPSDFQQLPISMQIAHGEGRFTSDHSTIDQLEQSRQVVFRYTNASRSETVTYPDNPNGAVNNIAGICDTTGLILGMMPHPERSIGGFHPNTVRTYEARSAAHKIFDGIVTYARKS